MKKFLVVLLSLGLIVAFGATASAADVKFGGSYYLVGVYNNNPNVTDNSYSKAYFYTRTRIQPVFAIAEGLTFTARMDALEKQWGQTNWKGGTDDLTATRGNSANIPKRGIQESLEFERAYVTFLTGLGMFQIGYQNVDDWGTDFGDYSNSRPRAAFATKFGPMTLNLTYEKVFENDTAGNQNHLVDSDNDTYAVSAIYNAKGIEAGLLYKYYMYNCNRISGVRTEMSQLSPYLKATFGPVYVEGEATYWFGKSQKVEAPLPVGTPDVKLQAYSLYLKAKVNLGPAYVGGLGAYVSGDDLKDTEKDTVAKSGGGTNFAPALILMNDALNTWGGGTVSATVNSRITTSKYNIVLFNAFAGFNPTPKLNVEAAITYAMADKKALSRAGDVITEAVSDKMGTEFDVKATYKIYDNLSYMVGAGYLWAGDYFKGADQNRAVSNDYVLLNQLTLSF
jgi:hypothetical protein